MVRGMYGLRNVMKEIWDRRISRAELLASERPESKELLTFYAALLRSQKEVYEYLRTRKAWLPCGVLERDLPVLRVMLPTLLRSVESSGPDTLASQARSLLEQSETSLDEMLIEY